jgi:hypothetical protein
MVEQTASSLLTGSNLFLTDQNKPVYMADVHGPGHLDSLNALFESLSKWVKSRVQNYRFTGEGLNRIVPELSEKLQEIWVLLALTIAIFRDAEHLAELHENLQVIGGFVTYVDEDWDEILHALVKPEQDAIENLRDILKRINKRLGVEIYDHAEGGYYIKVSEPQISAQK